MRLGWRAKNPVSLDDAARADVEAFLTELDDDDDVQHIYPAM
jgi:transcriptional/translational regulatory protein YebC/TACO1